MRTYPDRTPISSITIPTSPLVAPYKFGTLVENATEESPSPSLSHSSLTSIFASPIYSEWPNHTLSDPMAPLSALRSLEASSLEASSSWLGPVSVGVGDTTVYDI